MFSILSKKKSSDLSYLTIDLCPSLLLPRPLFSVKASNMNLFSWLPGFNKNVRRRVSKTKAVTRQGQKQKQRKQNDYAQAVDRLTAAVNRMRDDLANVVSLTFSQTPADMDKDTEMSPAPDMEEHEDEPVHVVTSKAPEPVNPPEEDDEPEGDYDDRDYDTEQLMAQIYRDIHAASLPDRVKSTLEFGKLLAAEARSFSFNSWIKMNIALQTQEMFKVIQYATRRFSSNPKDLRNHISAVVDQLSDGTDKLGRASCIIEDERHLIIRYGTFASKHGWMMLSILANSAAFREAARTLGKVRWMALRDCIYENKNSIEVFAKSRELNWKVALEQRGDFNKWVLFRNEQYPDLKPQHPHHLIVPAGAGLVRNPIYEGKHQVNILNNLYDKIDFCTHERPFSWPDGVDYPSDPTEIAHKLGDNCSLCSQHNCSCNPNTHPSVIRPLVELVEYDGKGVGIRALQPIENGNQLGEYVGEVLHPRDKKDPESMYAFAITAIEDSWEMLGTINSGQYGNWTRYINHSCDPNTLFSVMIIGSKQRVMIKTARDVAMFEELTIHYGDEYWINRDVLCQCGSRNCRFATIEQIKELRKLDEEL